MTEKYEYTKSPRQSESYYCNIMLSERVFSNIRSPVPEREVSPYDKL